MKKISSIILFLFCTVGFVLNAQQLVTDNLYITYGNSEYVKNIAKMELVSEAEYEREKAKAVDYMDRRTSIITKKNGQLRLPYIGGEAIYTDHKTDGDDYAEYNYIGFIPFLNAYVIEYVWRESSGFMLVGKISGEEIEYFEEYPFISSNKRNLVTIKQDPFDMTAKMSFYKINGQEIVAEVSDNFEFWTPYYQKDIFWSTNNSLYIPALNIDVFKAGENLSGSCQYIKITLK